MQVIADHSSIDGTAQHSSTILRVTVGWLSLLALPVLGFFFVLLLTPHGIGVSPDSVTYIEGARNLLRGFGYVSSLPHGQVKPITDWPPLFSSSLALIGLSGVDPWIAARWLNSFLLAVNIFLTGHLAKRYSNGSLTAALLAGILLLVSYDFLNVHRMAWSEPLFISLTLLGFTFILKYLEIPKSWLLLTSALFMSLAFLTRYFAAPLIGATALSILFLKKGTARTRLRDSACFTLLAVVPMLCWCVRNRIVSGQIAGLLPGYIGLPHSLLEGLLASCTRWFFYIPGGRLPVVLAGFVRTLPFLLFLYALLLLVPRIRRNAASKSFIIFIVLQSFCYVIFYVFVCVFISNGCVSSVRRYMTPLHPLAVVVFVLVIVEHLRLFQRRRLLMSLGPLLCIVVIGMNIRLSSNKGLLARRSNGRGYASRAFRESPTIKAVASLPDGAFIASNNPNAILFFTRRGVAYFPHIYDPHRNNMPRDDYDAQIELLRRQCTNGNCFFVVFDESTKSRTYLAAPEQLIKDLSLAKVLECKDGSIYKPRQ